MNLKKYRQKGEIIFHEGDPSDYAYIIVSGSIEILEKTPDGQKVLGVLGRNEIFGEIGLIDGLPRSATARVKQDSLIYILTPEIFASLAQENPETLLPILRILTNRLRETLECLKLGDKTPDPGIRRATQSV